MHSVFAATGFNNQFECATFRSILLNWGLLRYTEKCQAQYKLMKE